MIELDVQTKPRAAAREPAAAASYLVLGDFGAANPAGPRSIDRDNIDEVLASLDVQVAGARIREIEDFHPDRLYRNVEAFRSLTEAEAEPPPPARSPSSPRADIKEILRPSSLLEQMVEGGGDPFQQYVRELGRAHAAAPEHSKTLRAAALSETMRALLHHARFQALEAAWRGLDFVVRRMDDESARVHIAQFSPKDLTADVAEASDLKKTRTYALLHHRPWRAVFGLYSFGGKPADIEMLGRIALLAASARAPFVAEGSVDMGPHWQELCSIPETGHLGLALPRFLLRLPYGARAASVESFAFEEMPGVPVHSEYLWGNPALACLTLLAGEPGEGDGLDLRGLPVHSYQEDGEWKNTPCAEVLMTVAQAQALMQLGLMPLVSFRDSDRVRLAGFRAINGEPLPLGR